MLLKTSGHLHLNTFFSPLCCVIWSKSGAVTYQRLIGAYSFYSVNFARNASTIPGLKDKLDIWWAFVAVHWAAAGAAIHIPLPFSLLQSGQPSTTIRFIKNTGVRPGAAPWCWETFTSRRPALPDDQAALLVTRNGADLKMGGVHERKTAVWSKFCSQWPCVGLSWCWEEDNSPSLEAKLVFTASGPWGAAQHELSWCKPDV